MMRPCCDRCNKHTHDVMSINEWNTEKAIESFIRLCYFDHLCESCINEIRNKLSEIGPLVLPENLNKGEHYYIENGKWVFSEKYHLLKNYCCNNECRHCPYGYKHDL